MKSKTNHTVHQHARFYKHYNGVRSAVKDDNRRGVSLTHTLWTASDEWFPGLQTSWQSARSLTGAASVGPPQYSSSPSRLKHNMHSLNAATPTNQQTVCSCTAVYWGSKMACFYTLTPHLECNHTNKSGYMQRVTRCYTLSYRSTNNLF